MRDYSKISPAVWQSARFKSLPSQDGRYLYLYLLTSHHQSSAGCYQLPDGYACTDLQWPLDRYAAARKELCEADLIKFDSESSVVMIARWFKHNPPMSPSHLIGIERLLERLPSQIIIVAAQEALRESWDSILASQRAKGQKQQRPTGGLPRGSEAHHVDRLNTNYLNRGQF